MTKKGKGKYIPPYRLKYADKWHELMAPKEENKKERERREEPARIKPGELWEWDTLKDVDF